MRLFLLFSLLCISIASSAAVYRWVDENGKVHYTDEPKENAELVEINQNTQNTVELNAVKRNSPAQEKPKEQPTLELTIVSPIHEETIRSNEGKIDVTVGVAPRLPKGVLLALFVDGEIKAQPQTSTLFKLSGINRGEHTIVVKALDQNGKVLALTPPRKIFLHQATVILRPTPRGN
ncbi:DUF4124 domain-containing protein [Shewanella gaetbuli]